MPDVRKFGHAHLRVPDLERSVDYYRDVFALRERARQDGIVYLETAPDSFYDLIDQGYVLALEAGEPGIDHVAVRVTDDRLDDAIGRLDAHDVPFETREGIEPGQGRAVRFDLPGRLPVDLDVTQTNENPDRGNVDPGTHQYAPNGTDHVTLASPDVEADATFLRDVLGARISDVAMAGPDTWAMAFTRFGDHHHDIAFIMDPSAERTSLFHVAWQMTDVAHMKQFADVLAARGDEIEVGFTRHVLGNNVSLYWCDPNDNQMEITTEVQTMDPDTPTTFHHEHPDEIVTHWTGTHPPLTGSE